MIHDVVSVVVFFRGKMTWEDGNCYEGEFVNGLFHGYVTV